jgi:predicted Zn-dependent protease
VRQLGRELGIRYVLEGSVQRGGTRLRVNVELIDAESGGHPVAWSVSGWLRIYLGEPANAIERLERSRRLSPLDPIAYIGYGGMAFAHLLVDRYDEAVSWAAKSRNGPPNWATSRRVAAIAYALSDRIVEAREAMARLCEIDPTLRLLVAIRRR